MGSKSDHVFLRENTDITSHRNTLLFFYKQIKSLLKAKEVIYLQNRTEAGE